MDLTCSRRPGMSRKMTCIASLHLDNSWSSTSWKQDHATQSPFHTLAIRVHWEQSAVASYWSWYTRNVWAQACTLTGITSVRKQELAHQQACVGMVVIYLIRRNKNCFHLATHMRRKAIMKLRNHLLAEYCLLHMRQTMNVYTINSYSLPILDLCYANWRTPCHGADPRP